MKRKNIVLCLALTLLMALSFAVPVVSASEQLAPTPFLAEIFCNDIGELVSLTLTSCLQYFETQVSVEVFCSNSGEPVSKTYFDVTLPILYLNNPYMDNPYMGIEPLWDIHVLDMRVWSDGLPNHVTNVHSTAPWAYYRYVNLLCDSTTWVIVNINTHITGNNLGSAILDPGQHARFRVPFGTISYNISASPARRTPGRWDYLHFHTHR